MSSWQPREFTHLQGFRSGSRRKVKPSSYSKIKAKLAATAETGAAAPRLLDRGPVDRSLDVGNAAKLVLWRLSYRVRRYLCMAKATAGVDLAGMERMLGGNSLLLQKRMDGQGTYPAARYASLLGCKDEDDERRQIPRKGLQLQQQQRHQKVVFDEKVELPQVCEALKPLLRPPLPYSKDQAKAFLSTVVQCAEMDLFLSSAAPEFERLRDCARKAAMVQKPVSTSHLFYDWVNSGLGRSDGFYAEREVRLADRLGLKDKGRIEELKEYVLDLKCNFPRELCGCEEELLFQFEASHLISILEACLSTERK